MKSLEKAKRIFSRSIPGRTYLRERERTKIKEFISSTEYLLNISGNPGTGKTSTVLNALKGKKCLYLNSMKVRNVYQKIVQTKVKIVVVDEFDRYYKENGKEYLSLIKHVKEEKKKLISISNTLEVSENTLYFKPYTSEEIGSIIKNKIREEIGVEIVDDIAMEVISRKFGDIGDIRRVFDYLLDLIKRKYINEREDKKDEICVEIKHSHMEKKNKEITKIKIGDILCEHKRCQKDGDNIHHRIVRELLTGGINIDCCYKKYLERCKEMKLQFCDRNDFNLIYEIARGDM
ncbi:uncharacterized protein LOC114933282 [Nylanderia fulva]|uniref:uncharacterized protein LOC114933282 n=1 Tax=Nylanderia fulva TaxID=613905 RepID=UPI0010FB7F0A|nr:uncharacterized protein LOC114933282 [Nylanderia fulva]